MCFMIFSVVHCIVILFLQWVTDQYYFKVDIKVNHTTLPVSPLDTERKARKRAIFLARKMSFKDFDFDFQNDEKALILVKKTFNDIISFEILASFERKA